eukprot:141031-Prorocentrum_minimum.AAC.1
MKLKCSSERRWRPSEETSERSKSFKYTFVRSSESILKTSLSSPALGQVGQSSPDGSHEEAEGRNSWKTRPKRPEEAEGRTGVCLPR